METRADRNVRKHASRRASVEGGDVRDARAGSSHANAPGRRTACARGGDGVGSRSASVSLARTRDGRVFARARARASDGVRKKEEDDPRERRGGRTRRTTS